MLTLEIPQQFMETEFSLLHMQETSTGPYPEPHQSSLYRAEIFLQDSF